MKVVTDKGEGVTREYDLLSKFPAGSDLEMIGASTLRRLVLQLRQKHIEDLAAHRRVIREQEEELSSCMADKVSLAHDVDRLITNAEQEIGT